LLNVKRNVYAGVSGELSKEFKGKSIEQIRQNNDMILIEGDIIVIKLRLPDKKQRLSKRDGFRLMYLVSKVDELVVFLDIYPKNGPSQQLDIDDVEIKRLVSEFIEEGENDSLESYSIE
jgi:mRNA-degrading endonuclease RelE of RelBE toxin-antitoxin system